MTSLTPSHSALQIDVHISSVEAPLRSPAAGNTPLDALRILPLPPVDDEAQQANDDTNSPPHENRTAFPPQIGKLDLPSTTFSDSFTELFAPLDISSALDVPRPRPRAISRLSFGPNGALVARQRRSTLVGFTGSSLKYSGPPSLKDDRRRCEGKYEDAWIGPFPTDGLDDVVDGKEVEQWTDEEWVEVSRFLLSRGYIVDLSQRVDLTQIPASRKSDGLPLSAFFLHSDSDTYELDIVEHLALPSTMSMARQAGGFCIQPVVGIVPLSAGWTAVLVERRERWDGLSVVDGAQAAKDLVGSVSLLHNQHIVHLGLSPSVFVSSRHSLFPAAAPHLALSASGFLRAIQLDPLAKPGSELMSEPLDTLSDEQERYIAPEAKEDKPWEPISADCFSVGKLLGGLSRESMSVASVSSTFQDALSVVAPPLTNPDPAERMSLRTAQELLNGGAA